jgi:hypothetical protein
VYLNVYVPHLQTAGAVVGYLHTHKGKRFASTATEAPMTDAFVRNIEHFVEREGVDMVDFDATPSQGRRHSAVLQRFKKTEGVLYVGKAQEQARVLCTQRRRSQTTGGTYPWIDR